MFCWYWCIYLGTSVLEIYRPNKVTKRWSLKWEWNTSCVYWRCYPGRGNNMWSDIIVGSVQWPRWPWILYIGNKGIMYLILLILQVAYVRNHICYMLVPILYVKHPPLGRILPLTGLIYYHYPIFVLNISSLHLIWTNDIPFLMDLAFN